MRNRPETRQQGVQLVIGEKERVPSGEKDIPDLRVLLQVGYRLLKIVCSSCSPAPLTTRERVQ